MTLDRPARGRARVTLVPLIDVLFILLVYFMVTSVYLDLDMIPMTSAERSAPAPSAVASGGTPLLLRINAEGQMVLRGQPLSTEAATTALTAEVAAEPGREVVILPSPRADLQSLATALDTLSQAGVTRSRVMRLEARP